MIEAALAINEAPTLAEAFRVLAEAARDPSVHGYPPFRGLPALREAMGAPQFLAHLEQVVKETPDYEARLATIRDRMAKLIEIWKQRNAAQAAAASGD